MPSIKDEIRLRASNRRHFSVDILEAITDGEETEGMEGAPQLTLNLVDPTGALMASDKLLRDAVRETGDPAAKTLRPIDVDIEGRWYRLLGAQAQDGTVTLTFEAREVAYLRQHDKHLVASRSDITRALFIRRMVNEVGKKPRKVKRADGRGSYTVQTDPIPFWSPEIRKKRPVAKATAGARKELVDDAEQVDIGETSRNARSASGVTVKGKRANSDQKRNMLEALAVVEDLNPPRDAVLALMLAPIAESGWSSGAQNPRSSAGGPFQMLDSTASALGISKTDVRAGARVFLTKGFGSYGGAIALAKQGKNPAQIAAMVEAGEFANEARSGGTPSFYNDHLAEAKKNLAALGSSSGPATSSSDGNGSYYKQFTFERKEGENSWAAMGRLAGDVTRRIFLQYDPDQRVRTLIYASDEELFEQRVRLKLELDGPSLASEPSYQLDYRKTAREVELEILGEWRVPVGQPIRLLPGRDGSPIAGRWLVWEVRRPWGSETVTVSLRQPQKDKPEPRPEAAQRSDNSASDAETDFAGGGSGEKVKGAISGSPVPGQRPHGPSHPTAGLPGYPAFDYMAPAGTPCVAPVDGKIERLSGKDPSLGGPAGGALGYSIYLTGRNGKSYFMTHLDKVLVKVGQNVSQGEQIAEVANGPSSWSTPHVHMGVKG